MFDVIIIGAGFAGAVLAERFATQQNKSVLLIERRQHIGGNCYDERDDNGILIHKYGPHLFHTDDEEVWNYLSQFTDWHVYHHHVEAMIDGQIVPLPFNLNTLNRLFPQPLAEKLESALLNRYDFNTKVPILKLKQSTDRDLRYLADYIYEKIFLHYTEKQWGLSPENIEGAGLDDRLCGVVHGRLADESADGYRRQLGVCQRRRDRVRDGDKNKFVESPRGDG